MNVKINQNQLSRFLGKFLSQEEKDTGFFIKMLKLLKINGQDEEIGKYILNQIKQENIENYNFDGDKVLGMTIQFSIKTFPLVLTAQRIFFNKGGGDYEFELTSPVFGDDVKLDLSYSMLNNIYKELINYR